MTAPEKRPALLRLTRCQQTEKPPALSPKIVTREASPPKAAKGGEGRGRTGMDSEGSISRPQSQWREATATQKPRQLAHGGPQPQHSMTEAD